MNRKPYLSIFAFALVCLAMGLLTSCTIGSKSGGGGGNTPAAIAATSGSGQSIAVSGTYTALSATVTNSAGAGVSGVSVVFAVVAGSSGATASFATGGATDTETTNSSGVATTSQVLTAGTVAGGFTVTATASGASIPPATFTETNTALAAATLTATSGAGQSATIGAAFTNPLVATVTDANSNPVQGVSVTFTAPASGASGTFASSGTATETDTTDVNGNATSSVLTANSTTGGPYNVVASSTGLTSVNFAETNTSGVAVIGNGNYAFTLSGLDTDDYSLYFVSGVFTVSGGAITGGEQDYVDYSNYSNNSTTGGADLINPTGSTITTTADGNMQIVLTTCSGSTCTSTDGVVGVNGVETINATLRPTNANQAVLVEFDGSGAATGEMRLQDPTAAAATPSLGYAFQVSGFDASEDILNIGGIINVDGAGTISGSGSIFDANDDSSGTALQAETLQANTGTVSAPDGFGRVVFSITPTDTTDFQQISWVGYIVDSTRVYLVETADSYVGTTGGIAFSQGASTGTFSSSSISSSTYGTAMTGFDGNGPLQVVGALTFNSSGTVSGFIDFNDLSGSEPVSPDPITAPAYTVDSTGRVTITGATDGVVETINLQLYLNGNGQVVAVTMDTGDNLGSTLGGQLSGPFSNANFTGNYAMAAWGWDGSETGEFSAVGTSTATGTGDTFSGFADLNYFNSTTTTVPAADATVSGSYTLSANSGILTPSSITGLDVDSGFTNTDAFNFYQVDSIGTTVVIETDSNQLTLGIFQP